MTAIKVALGFFFAASSLADACWPHTHTEHKLVVVEVQEPRLSGSNQQRVRPEDTGDRIQASTTSDLCASCTSGEECRNGRCQPMKAAENHPSAPREQPARIPGKSCFLESECAHGERCDWDTSVCVAKSRMNESCKKSFDCVGFPDVTCEGVCKPLFG